MSGSDRGGDPPPGAGEEDSRKTSTLVLRLRTGDPDAFRELMLAYYDIAERFAYSLVRSRDTAADITQDVFTRLWERRGQLDPARSIKTYLLTSVRNRALDHLKHEAIVHRFDVRARDTDPAVAPSPEDELLASAAAATSTEAAAQLLRAIAALPERRRAVLALRFDQALSFKAIGEILGMSDKAAQQLLLRTIAELRRKLRP